MSILFKTKFIALTLLTSLTLFTSCEKESIETQEDIIESRSTINVKRPFFFALSSGGELIQMAIGSPAQIISSSFISGLNVNEHILAIDFRPSTGQLYGVSNQSRLFTINQKTGAAVAVNPTPFTPAINGSVVGFDFNPTVDRIRLITDNDQNLRDFIQRLELLQQQMEV